MFSVREKPWHYDETQDRTTIFAEYPGREVAMKAAGHDFVVEELPVYDGQHQPIAGWKMLTRGQDEFEAAFDSQPPFAVVKDSYGVVQNDSLWDVVDAICDQPNVKYETGGVLREGAILWVLARLDEPVVIPGDNSTIYPYVMATTSHDMSGGMKAITSSIRTVCWNTWMASTEQARRNGTEFMFRHTKNVMARIEDAKAALGQARQNQSAFVELSMELAAQKITKPAVERFVQDFIPTPPGDIISDRVVGNIETARALVRNIVFEGETISDELRLTKFALFQAGIEYLDHMRAARTPATRFSRTLLRQEPLKSKLLPLVRSAK